MAWACRRCHRVFAEPTGDGTCPHDGGTLASLAERGVDDEHTGRVFDEKYRVGRLLGRGGMGCVHEAMNLRLEQTVAVKFFSLQPGSSSASTLASASERFRREALTTVKLRHPNVVEVLDFSVDQDGTQYIVMELLEGTPLDAALAGAGLTVGRGLEILSHALKAIHYAHSQGVVHRDLKPSNVYLTRVAGREVVKVLDFGIARVAGLATITVGPVGTWRYSAPEQLAGGQVGPAADVYSAGVILHEMLAGGPPAAVPLGAGVAAPLGAIVARATARDPPARYADAGVMRAALDGALAALSDAEKAAPLPRLDPDRAPVGMPSPAVPAGAGSIVANAAGRTPAPGVVPRTVPGAPPGSNAPAAARRSTVSWIVGGLAAACVLAAGVWLLVRTSPRSSGGVEEPDAPGSTTAALAHAPDRTAPPPIAPDDGPPDAETAPDLATGAAGKPPEPVARPVAVAAIDGAGAGPAGEAASEAADPVSVTFVTRPDGAKVYLVKTDGTEEDLCSTNCMHRFDRGAGDVGVVFRLSGYQDRRATFRPGSDSFVDVTLERPPAARRDGGASPLAAADAGRADHPASVVAAEHPAAADAAAAPGGTGFITVRAIPQSEVYLDGVHVGRSPLRRMEVSAGRHRIRLVPVPEVLGPGVEKPERTVTVTVLPGEIQPVQEYW